MIDLRIKDEESGLVENIPPNLLKSLIASSSEALKQEPQEQDKLRNSLSSLKPEIRQQQQQPEFEVLPEPGFVLKTKTSSGQQKVFINICHSPYVPKAPLISDDELEMLTSMKNEKVSQEMEKMSAKFKIPMSVSSLKKDKDKMGNECLVFDACVNSDAYERFQKDEKSLIFLMELALSFVSTKHNIDLFSEGYSVPKMKAKGPLAKHVIRRPKQPFIREEKQSTLHEEQISVAAKIEQMKKEALLQTKSSISSARLGGIGTSNTNLYPESLDETNPAFLSLPKPPSLKLEKQIKEGGKTFSCLCIRIELLDVESLVMADCIIEIEQKKFLFLLPKRYFVVIPLPVAIDIRKSKATFDKSNRTLLITLPSPQ